MANTWGGKRAGAGQKAGNPYMQANNWTEHPTFWQYKTLFSSRAAAVNASLRIDKLLKIISQVREIEQFEDGRSTGFRYAVYTQYHPFSRI